MRHIYFEKPEIPRPENSHLSKSRGDVFIFVPKPGEPLSNKTKRIIIGRATSTTMMHPNDNFRMIYPNLWSKYYEENVQRKEYQLNAGMYELMLGIGYHTGLYPLLQSVFGPLYGNTFMDLAMFSNQRKTDAMMTFRESMARQVIFSKDRVDDDWISDFLCNKVSDNDCMRFMDMWIDTCVRNGETDVWISLDGSNSDCMAKECSLAEPGHSKSHKDGKNIISYVYIISAKSGLPLAVTVVNGGMVDAKSFFDAIHLIKTHGLNIKGVMVDRGYCGADVISEIEKLNYPYVLMLKSDNFGHVGMYNEYAKEIQWNFGHWVESSSGTLFGCTSETPRKLFKHSDNEAFINLFFDGLNSAERSSALARKIMSVKKSIDKSIARGQEPNITPSMSRYIKLETGNDGKTTVMYRFENLQKDVAIKGFYSVATSENYGPVEANRLYKMRDCSEVMYSENKSQLGFTVPRNHTEKGVLAKLFVGFISSIVRFYIMDACRRLEYETNTMVMEMDRIHIRLNGISGHYLPIHDESKRHLGILKQFSVVENDLDAIAAEVNSREDPMTSQVRRLKSHEDRMKEEAEAQKLEAAKQEELKTTEKKTVGEEPKEPKNPGRPKGSKNKATLAREAKIAAGKIKPKEKGKPGRPKGSRNKVNVLLTSKHRKGRPPGSKNKKTLEREELARQQAAIQSAEPAQKAETTIKKKAGRPLGSKDKHPTGNRRGRVPGSRNKTTKTQDAILNKMSEEYGQKEP